MCEFVGYFGLIVFINTKSTVKLSINPDFWRIVILNENPLTNVKFFLVDDQWIFNILLDHILSLFTQRIVHNVIKFAKALNPSAS